METKFCLSKINDTVKVEIEGRNNDLHNMIASAIDSDPRIKEMILDCLLSITMKEIERKYMGEQSEDKVKEMLGNLNISLN